MSRASGQVRALLVTAVLLVLAGCTTVQTRIQEHAAFFSTLDPVTQAKLRAGEVEVGYSSPMAYIAFGRPDEVRRTRSTEGESVTWVYQYAHPVYEGSYLAGYTFYEVHAGGARRLVNAPEWVERYHYETRVYLRLVFVDGRVVLVERLER